MSWFLPHHDENPEERQKELQEARQKYQFRYDTYVSPLAICKDVPVRDTIMPKWLLKIGKSALKVLANRMEIEGDSKIRDEHRKRHQEFEKNLGTSAFKVGEILDYIQTSLDKVTSQTATTLEDYDEIFRAISLPPVHKFFREDKIFAWMRVAGPNSVLIERIASLPDNFPVTAEMYRSAMPEDTLDAAAGEGRLYLVDYKALAGAKGGTWKDVKKYLYAPLALFAVDKQTKDLMPVAIQCEQTPGTDNPIFTPRNGFNWLIAKTIVEVADGNFHEAITHLGRTHLFVEPFVVTTHRQLSTRHPLYCLLSPHFEGTLNINKMAVNDLIAPGGKVDQGMGPKIEAVWQATVAEVESYLFDQAWLPKTFAARGVDDPELLPKYPYRDDATLYWDAIRDWVTAYLSIYYSSDADVAEDTELTQWFREIVAENGGRIKGLDGPTGSLSYLADVVTMVIFTSSCQHAAVNFPQYDLMSYVPNVPGACYTPRPTTTAGATERDWLDLLPPLNQAETQTEFLYLLGSVYYTELGGYSFGHFLKRDVRSALDQFQDRIKQNGQIIAERNKKRILPYEYLLPSGIPQSINI